MKKNNRIVVIPSRGIGDGLLMMIAAEQFLREGYEVVTVHPRLQELQSWFPGHQIVPRYLFADTDYIIIENDNSERVRLLKQRDRQNLSIFYPTYSAQKHGAYDTERDCIFDATQSMAENIALATAYLLKKQTPSKKNGLTPPQGLTYRKYQKKILLHPSSSLLQKNWSMKHYHTLASLLEKDGFEPLLSPVFDTLHDLATAIYESGFVIGNDSLAGHLASNLGIPSLVIAERFQHMQLWRPGWYPGQIVTLPRIIPQWKFFSNRWQALISPHKALKFFLKLAATKISDIREPSLL